MTATRTSAAAPTPARTPRLGLVHGGSFFQLATLEDPAVRAYRPRALYLPELDETAVADLDILFVADRLHPRLLRERAEAVLSVARRGGTVVVLGENDPDSLAEWLPGLAQLRPAETNFWWWRTGEDSGIRTRSPEHEAWEFLTERAAVWHYHGLLRTPAGARVLAVAQADVVPEEDEAGCALLYEDTVSTPGRLIVATMDPIYHHGSAFMPGATELLYGLLRWTTATSPPLAARSPMTAVA